MHSFFSSFGKVLSIKLSSESFKTAYYPRPKGISLDYIVDTGNKSNMIAGIILDGDSKLINSFISNNPHFEGRRIGILKVPQLLTEYLLNPTKRYSNLLPYLFSSKSKLHA